MKIWNRLDIAVRHYAPAGPASRRVRTKKRRTLVTVTFAEQPVARALVDGTLAVAAAATLFRERPGDFEKYADGWALARALGLVPDTEPLPAGDPACFHLVLGHQSLRPMREVSI